MESLANLQSITERLYKYTYNCKCYIVQGTLQKIHRKKILPDGTGKLASGDDGCAYACTRAHDMDTIQYAVSEQSQLVRLCNVSSCIYQRLLSTVYSRIQHIFYAGFLQVVGSRAQQHMHARMCT